MPTDYLDFEEVRRKCFESGKCYMNRYKGGIVEYICLHDNRPCAFQCIKIDKAAYNPFDPYRYVPNEKPARYIYLLSFEYKIE